MIQREGHFQYLVVLAVAGQISEAELEKLSEHLAHCSSCSRRMAEMEATNLRLFLSLAADVGKPKVSSRMQKRFLLRAAHAGVLTSPPSPAFWHSGRLQFAAFLVAVCLLVVMGWRKPSESSSGRAIGNTLQVKTPAPAQLTVVSGPARLALLTTPIADRSNDKPDRRSRLPRGKARIPSPSVGVQEAQGVARPLFRLDTALFPRHPGVLQSESSLSNLREINAGDLMHTDEGLTSHFPAPAAWNPSMVGNSNQRIFHYSATLASVSVHDEQAVFGLKPRVRDLSFSNTLASIRFR